MTTTAVHADVRHGDALTLLPTLNPASVECVITDPPLQLRRPHQQPTPDPEHPRQVRHLHYRAQSR